MKRPYVISFLNPKGGTGKSTLAINVACAFSLRGRSVGLLDTDPQKSAFYWQYLRFPRLIESGQLADIADSEKGFPVVIDRSHGIDRQAFTDLDFEIIVIDGFARLDDDYQRLTNASDLLLIPVRPTPLDIWGVSDFVAMVKARQRQAGGHPSAAFVISMQRTGTKLARGADKSLSPYDLPVLKSRTSHRIAYQRSITRGLSVVHFEPDSAAAAEIKAVAAEILEIRKGKEAVRTAA
jgi:chromosome partitioning protein